MIDKDLRKLNRKGLLELLLKQTERANELEAKLNEAENKLRDRSIAENEAGSIAEAALKLNGIFEAADAAASQYLENVRRLSETEISDIPSLPEAKLRAKKLLEETEKLCKKRLEETEDACRALREETEKLCAEREDTSDMKMRRLSKILRVMYTEKKLLDSIFEEIKPE